MPILGLETTRRQIPGSEDVMLLRTSLPPIALERARDARRRDVVREQASMLGGLSPEQLEAIRPPAKTQAERDPGLTRGQVCLDTAGADLVAEWDYCYPDSGAQIPVTPAMVASLDPATRAGLHGLAFAALVAIDRAQRDADEAAAGN